jgi:hypothetical protein
MIEDGVCQVTNWILGPGEMLLNAQQNVGYDVVSAEDLRRNHETLELQCRVCVYIFYTVSEKATGTLSIRCSTQFTVYEFLL